MFALCNYRYKHFQAILLILLWLCCLGVAAAQTVASPSPGAPPYQWPRSHNFDVEHYKIVVSFDWEKRAVKGETTITLHPLKPGFNELQLDAGNMTINSVRLEKGGQLKFRYQDKEHLFITLDHDYLPTDELAVTINYSAIPNRKGMTIFTPTAQEPKRRYQIWTQGETTTNHYWFPCYDYPNDKATSETIVTAEDKYRVISNGRLVNVHADAANHMKTWHWVMDKPFSSYLVSLVVGEYHELKDQFKGKAVSSYVYPDQVENGRTSLSKIAAMVEYFSQRIGYDYPYDKYSQTAVQDFGGAMENISATTMSDQIVHDARTQIDNSSDGVTSHELAHQWFGDLLTCNNWGEIWLNESFATFFNGVWNEHDLGADEGRCYFLQNQASSLGIWNSGQRRPIVTNRYESQDSIFDAYVYQRGSVVLDMLRFTLGEEAFWRSINHYVKANPYHNVTTADLIKAIEEATGQNLGWFFDEWVYKMGHPIFEVTSRYDESNKKLILSVKQTQQPDDKHPWFQSPEFFTTPIDIAVTTEAGEQIYHSFIKQRNEEFTFELTGKPLIINFNRGGYILSEVKFERSTEDLVYQLLHDRDVIGRIQAAAELKGKPGELAEHALMEALHNDRVWEVRAIAADSLAEFKTDGVREALLAALHDQDSHVRTIGIYKLGELKDVKLADIFINIISTDASYVVVANAERALAKTAALNAKEVLLHVLDQETSTQDVIRGGAIDGLVTLNDKDALPILIKYAQPGNSAGTRASAISALAQVGKGQDEVFNIIISALDAESPRVILTTLQALKTFGDIRAIPRLEALLQRSDLNNIPYNSIKDTIDQIKAANAPKPDKPEEKK